MNEAEERAIAHSVLVRVIAAHEDMLASLPSGLTGNIATDVVALRAARAVLERIAQVAAESESERVQA